MLMMKKVLKEHMIEVSDQNLGHHPNSLLFYMTNTIKMIMMRKQKMTTIIDLTVVCHYLVFKTHLYENECILS